MQVVFWLSIFIRKNHNAKHTQSFVGRSNLKWSLKEKKVEKACEACTNVFNHSVAGEGVYALGEGRRDSF